MLCDCMICNCMLCNYRSLPAGALISRGHKMVLVFRKLIGFTKGNATLEKKVVLLAALKVSTACLHCALLTARSRQDCRTAAAQLLGVYM
jgi:hypothetical protein